MKKQPQKTTNQVKISADLPVQPLTDLESSQLSGGVTWAKTASSNPKTDAGSTWSGQQGAWQASTDGTINAI